jgi:hypothetical protein
MAVLVLVGIVAAGCGPSSSSTETLVGSQVETRTVLALRVSEAELQGWLPAPWRVTPITSGPSKDANLLIVFRERLIDLDAGGKAVAGGVGREVVLAVPAKHPQKNEPAPVVIRVFTADPQAVPGPYKNSKKVTILRMQTVKGSDAGPGNGEEFWDLEDISGGKLELRFQFQRALPARSRTELKLYSSVEPSVVRIYRADQGVDVVQSVPSAVDGVKPFELQVTMPELRKLLNGSEQLVSIEIFPWWVGQVFVPGK